MSLKTQLVTLNNKSRKGQYVRITGKGQPTRYYKYDAKISMLTYKQYYNATIQNPEILRLFRRNIAGYIKAKKEQRKALGSRTLAKSPTINETLHPGHNTVTLDRVTLSKQQRDFAIRQLLKDYINKDKDKTGNLLNLYTQNENQTKIRKYLSFSLQLLNAEGDVLATIEAVGKTLTEIKKDIIEEFPTKTEVTSSTSSYTWGQEFRKKIDKIRTKGYTLDYEQDGIVFRYRLFLKYNKD